MKTNNDVSDQAYDITKERGMKKKRVYYHITNPENVENIRRKGLLANGEGMIFVVTDMIVADPVARHQLFLNHYAVFMINSKGITGKVIQDRVAEFTAPYHRIVLQERILPRYVSFLASLIIDPNEPSPWDIFCISRLYGMNKAAAIKKWHQERAELTRQSHA